MIPVGSLVAAVDQVSGQQDEIDSGMSANAVWSSRPHFSRPV